jgi:hypothetical protein
MSKVYIGGCMRGTFGCESGSATAGALHFLSLAAAPTFAIAGLITGYLDVGPQDFLCSATQHASPLNGMVVMYLLMSAFHSAPWLKLISGRQNGVHRAYSGRGPNPFFDVTNVSEFPRTNALDCIALSAVAASRPCASASSAPQFLPPTDRR